ncbi:MAG: hypothetical protein AABZ39_10710 [Spirochaetota bacterium]
MICQICGEEEAVLHIQEIVGDARTELHVCKRCAEAKGILRDIASLNLTLSATVAPPRSKKKPRAKLRSLTCSRCGTTGDEYVKDHRAGCSHCYTDLSPVMNGVLKELHPGITHTGRVPKEPGNSAAEIIRLKSELALLLKQEDYERAATLRDAIAALSRTER